MGAWAADLSTYCHFRQLDKWDDPNEKCSPWPWVYELLVSSWWCYLGRFRRCGLGGGSKSLGHLGWALRVYSLTLLTAHLLCLMLVIGHVNSATCSHGHACTLLPGIPAMRDYYPQEPASLSSIHLSGSGVLAQHQKSD